MPTHKYNRGVYAAAMLVALKAMSGCDSTNNTVGTATSDAAQGGRGNEAVYISPSSVPPSADPVDKPMEVALQGVPVSLHASLAEARHFDAYSRYQSMFDDTSDGPTTVANPSSIDRSRDAGSERLSLDAGAIGTCLLSTRNEQDPDQD